MHRATRIGVACLAVDRIQPVAVGDGILYKMCEQTEQPGIALVVGRHKGDQVVPHRLAGSFISHSGITFVGVTEVQAQPNLETWVAGGEVQGGLG